MAERELTNKLLGNQEPVHATESRGTAARWTDEARGSKEGSPTGLASPKPLGDIAKELVANGGKNPAPSPSPAMADNTTNLQGNQVPLHPTETRARKEHRAVSARGAKNGNKRGLASPKPRGDKVANKPAMADLTHNLAGNQVLLHPKETRARKEHRAFYARGSKNGSNQGLLLPKPCGNKIANEVTTNKKMDDRVKNGKQLNAERLGAVLARLEQKRARGSGPPPRKRGAVKKAIVEAGVKKVIDTGKAFCCASGPFDVDAFVGDLPLPTRSEPTATLWAKVEA